MSDIVLRDYQGALINDARRALARSRRVVIQLPTGGGKTPLASFMAGQSASNGTTVWFICHRAELVEQTHKTFRKFGIPHGIIAAGWPMNLREPVQVCSIDTLKNRLHKLPPPGLIIWDECHHIGAAGWARVMGMFPQSYHVGLTATPWRLDGTGLGEWFEDMVMGPGVPELIERGYLSPFDYYGATLDDMQGVKKRAGDYVGKEQAERLAKPKLIGDAIRHWRKCAEGMRTVGFAANVAHSQYLAEQFNAAGIPSAHLDGGTPRAERARIIQGFAKGDILHLFNVNLFGEGFDLAAVADCDVTVDAVSMHRRTESLSLFMQMVGRGLRPAPGKVAAIIDHTDNWTMHGLPDDPREWTLEGREKGAGSSKQDGPPPPVICDGCFHAVRRPLPPNCPHCGKRLLADAKPPEVADGELRKLTEADRQAAAEKRRQEQALAGSLGELTALAARRGYKNPQKWAWKVWSGRQAKRRSA